MLKQYPITINKLWFASEASFYTNGRVECHNLVYLAENPDNPESQIGPPCSDHYVTVWAALNQDTLIGPYICVGKSDNLTQHLFLKKFIFELKQLQRLQLKLYDPIFVYDDTPIHESSKELLNEEFPDHWIGSGSNYMKWPKLSPDLHPACFFLWGYIKHKVYKEPLAEDGITELGLRIQHAFLKVMPEMLAQALKAYVHRLTMIIETEGRWIDVHGDYEDESIF